MTKSRIKTLENLLSMVCELNETLAHALDPENKRSEVVRWTKEAQKLADNIEEELDIETRYLDRLLQDEANEALNHANG